MHYGTHQELLDSVHQFPGPYQIKAIGPTVDNFAERVVEAVLAEMLNPDLVRHDSRISTAGNHVSVTVNVTVENADQVMAIYSRIKAVKGLVMVF